MVRVRRAFVRLSVVAGVRPWPGAAVVRHGVMGRGAGPARRERAVVGRGMAGGLHLRPGAPGVCSGRPVKRLLLRDGPACRLAVTSLSTTNVRGTQRRGEHA